MAQRKKSERKADRPDNEEKSDLEREAEGGMRASEPGHLGEDRVTDLIDEVNELEGHNLPSHDSRDQAGRSDGGHADIAPREWSGSRVDKMRRGAKDIETAHGRDPEEEQRQVERYSERSEESESEPT